MRVECGWKMFTFELGIQPFVSVSTIGSGKRIGAKIDIQVQKHYNYF
jgi:hypothetical protein